MKTLLSFGLAAALVMPPPAFAKDQYVQDVSGDDGIKDPDGEPDFPPGAKAGTGANGWPGGNALEIIVGGRRRKDGLPGVPSICSSRSATNDAW